MDCKDIGFGKSEFVANTQFLIIPEFLKGGTDGQMSLRGWGGFTGLKLGLNAAGADDVDSKMN